MSGWTKAGIRRVLPGRILVCLCAAVAAGGAAWVNPGPAPAPAGPPAPNGAEGPPLVVSAWGLGSNPSLAAYSVAAAAIPSGRPFYIWLKLEGNAAALDAMQAEGGLPVVVHWTPDTANAGPPAPPLTTRLVVGNPRLAPALAGEVEHTGHFTWHTWTRKDTLSPGRWSVSLTYPGGKPLACGQELRPCRFSFTVG